MVGSVEIVDNTKSPIGYLMEIPNFANGMKYEFKPGVNIIIGENGCGKTTLLSLIRSYLMVDIRTVGTGMFNNALHKAHHNFGDNSDNEAFSESFSDGVIVKSDYYRQTFNYIRDNEISSNDINENSHISVGECLNSRFLSSGQSNSSSLGELFNMAFSLKPEQLVVNYEKIFKKYNYNNRIKYIKENKIKGDEFTFLIDEPDSSLDIENIKMLYDIFSFHKEQTQIIAVLHNPLLIASLSQVECVNVIEMTDGYLNKIKKSINSLLKLPKAYKLN